jgi:hypothetical protein
VRKKESLEELEKDVWPPPDESATGLVKRANILRKKSINDFTHADYRFMITQQMGTTYLLPNTLKILVDEPFIESEYYPGDLLESVLNVQQDLLNSNYNTTSILAIRLNETRSEWDRACDKYDGNLSIPRALERKISEFILNFLSIQSKPNETPA